MWSLYNSYNMKSSAGGIKAFGNLYTPLSSGFLTNVKTSKLKFNKIEGITFRSSHDYVNYKTYSYTYNNNKASIQQNYNGITNNYYTKMDLKNFNGLSYSDPSQRGKALHISKNSVPFLDYNIKSAAENCNKGNENNFRKVDLDSVDIFIIN